MFTIKIPKLNKQISVSSGSNLMLALLENDVPVASSCNGDGICGKCKVQVNSKTPINPLTQAEEALLKRDLINPNQRLSCQITLEQDVEVSTTYW